ncbi:MAG TPA: hypothetical protein VK596_03775, partial [Edaphobacter sp.]|nr:hypothetical protein [Edaphobacter sp.]
NPLHLRVSKLGRGKPVQDRQTFVLISYETAPAIKHDRKNLRQVLISLERFPEDSKPLRNWHRLFYPSLENWSEHFGYEFKRFIRLFPELSDSPVFAGIARLTCREEIEES